MSAAVIREKVHGELLKTRQLQRDRQRDTLRCGLSEIQEDFVEFVGQAEIIKLCNRIKRRKHADERDLFRLSRGFLSSAENIGVFLKTQGATNVLVKEFTGTSGETQILAAEVLCNLSLGDSGSAMKVAKIIASYLLSSISSQNFLLAQTCYWTIYNLISANDSVLDLFLSQKLDTKLVHTLQQGKLDVERQLEAEKCLAVLAASKMYVIAR